MTTEEKNNLEKKNDPGIGKLIEDHDFDGIQELDNRPPRWLMLLFYASIVWSAVYMFHYHVFKTGDLQDAEYDKEVAEAKANMPETSFDESNIAILTDAETMAKGKELYTTKTCNACHGMNGEGNAVGPNLTDEYWTNGGTSEEVFKAIKYGIPAKGMTPFKDQLSDDQIQVLTSYILHSLKGSNPDNAKAAEGEKVE